MIRIWDHLSLGARLLITASAILFLAGALLLAVTVRQEAFDVQSDVKAAVADELLTLPPLLGEAVVVGDYASLQRTLDRYAEHKKVAYVGFTDQQGRFFGSVDKAIPEIAPRWFFDALGFHDARGRVDLTIGGRRYGEVILNITAQAEVNNVWMHLIERSGLLLLAMIVDVLAIWIVLRAGLAPLQRLQAGADAIANGSLDTRLEIAGSTELRHVMTAFNRMAAATQGAMEQQRHSNADLMRFAEVSAHHLMEPTRRLGSYAQRLRNRFNAMPAHCNDAEVESSLAIIERDAGRLRAMVRDIQLYLAASEPRGKVQIEDADEAMAAVVRRLSPRIIELRARIDCAPLPPATLDRPRLMDLFAILLENALSHGRPGDPNVVPHIRISGERHDKVSRYRIGDNGAGIPRQYRERVFEIFERLAPASDESGSGIGLSIARRIVESRHGKIWINGEPNGGAAVTFELPDGDEP